MVIDSFATILGRKSLRPISREFKIAFVSASILVFITHFFFFSNYLINHDSVETFYTAYDYLHLGRWASAWAASVRGMYELPALSGVITAVTIGLTAGWSVRILSLKRTGGIVLASAFLATFPGVVSVLIYHCDWFFFALLCSAGSAYCAKYGGRWGTLAGAGLFALSCGIYQSYISYAIGLLVMDCILELYSEKPWRETLKRGARYIGMILAGFLLYALILQISLKVNGVTLSSYKGIDTMGLSQIGVYLQSIPKAYREFFTYFLSVPYVSETVRWLQHVLTLVGLATAGALVLRRKLYREPVRVILLGVGFAVIPLALSITSAITPTDINLLNMYAYTLHFLLCIRLVEMFGEDCVQTQEKRNACLQLTCAALCAVLCWTNIRVDNAAYMKMRVLYDNTMALANRIVMQVEQTEGYLPGETPVVIVGSPSSQYYNHAQTYFSQDGLWYITGVNFWSLLGTYSTHDFFMDILGTTFGHATQEQKDSLTESGVLDEMPCYPAQGSVQMYEDIVVVKLSDGNFT